MVWEEEVQSSHVYIIIHLVMYLSSVVALIGRPPATMRLWRRAALLSSRRKRGTVTPVPESQRGRTGCGDPSFSKKSGFP